uniref:Uncharacterized protein n=1 Tax=Triticum urartu TaxID=4572 RepID=A0A8R7TC48_TRIUA
MTQMTKQTNTHTYSFSSNTCGSHRKRDWQHIYMSCDRETNSQHTYAPSKKRMPRTYI